ncbi:hypothetical protein [Priestia aryabhattai]
MPKVKRIPFGMSDITIGEGADVMNFNGKDYLQAEGAELTITPIFEEINLPDVTGGVYDKRLTGWEAQLTITAAEENIDILEAGMMATAKITDTTSGETVGLMDGVIGLSLRELGKKVNIHPRALGSDKSLDVTIYKMASDGEFSRTAGNEQGNVTIQLTMFIKDNADPTKPGNFFYWGPKDPNAVA